MKLMQSIEDRALAYLQPESEANAASYFSSACNLAILATSKPKFANFDYRKGCQARNHHAARLASGQATSCCSLYQIVSSNLGSLRSTAKMAPNFLIFIRAKCHIF